MPARCQHDRRNDYIDAIASIYRRQYHRPVHRVFGFAHAAHGGRGDERDRLAKTLRVKHVPECDWPGLGRVLFG